MVGDKNFFYVCSVIMTSVSFYCCTFFLSGGGLGLDLYELQIGVRDRERLSADLSLCIPKTTDSAPVAR